MSTHGARNEKEAALLAERRAAERREEARAWRRGRDALADAAELRALDASAFALHARVPLLGGAARILWNGWLEDWSEFYEAHRSALDEADTPLSEASRARLRDYGEVLEAFGAFFALATELEERMGQPGWRRGWRETGFVLRRAAAFTRRHGGAVAKIQASRRQFIVGFPPFDRFVPSGVTTH